MANSEIVAKITNQILLPSKVPPSFAKQALAPFFVLFCVDIYNNVMLCGAARVVGNGRKKTFWEFYRINTQKEKEKSDDQTSLCGALIHCFVRWKPLQIGNQQASNNKTPWRVL